VVEIGSGGMSDDDRLLSEIYPSKRWIEAYFKLIDDQEQIERERFKKNYESIRNRVNSRIVTPEHLWLESTPTREKGFLEKAIDARETTGDASNV